MKASQTSTALEARPAAPDEADQIARTLASAFLEDPLVQWFVGRPDFPESRLVPTFKAMARNHLGRAGHEVFVSRAGDAAALWRGVDDWKLAPAELLRVLPALVRTNRLNLHRVLRTLAAVDAHHPDEPHVYLSILGTHVDRQGQGLGSAVLLPVLQRCDREGLPAYTESSNPRNHAFYFRHGFVPRGDLPVPTGCPPILPLWREPR